MQKIFCAFLVFAMSLSAAAAAAQGSGNDDIFTGDKRLACEAVLCLSSPQRPSECSSALNRFFGIKKFKKGKFSASRTKSARTQFLQLCPDAGDKNLAALVGAIGSTLNQCDAGYLNTRKVYYAQKFDVLKASWGQWELVGRRNNDVDSSRFNSRRYPQCTNRQLNYLANWRSGKDGPTYDLETHRPIHPVELTCYAVKEEIDREPPSDCGNLYRSNYSDYSGLKYENGKWIHQ